ncbi:unnamed protein product [Heligmosomoides polygyrus]|uniref:2OG-FeII_Oxy_2 domain-containing protein n=1 Tax=Heligmosomoides polygyrus TaxID=6339 RepID=A0A183G0C6_HELPZ|nr:unnamed protein product [Heligmosomoides polygyrus]
MRICSRLLSLVHFHNTPLWPKELMAAVGAGCRVIPAFISESEEAELLKEVEPHMKRLRYEKNHWDDAIHLYREREQRKWSPANEAVIQRIRDVSFAPDSQHLTYVHILDLHEDGVIRPHIDSVRYCGDVVTGVCLLSDAVMRLRHKDRKDELIADLLLPRRCLYRMGEEGRYDFTHEILANEESVFEGKKIKKSRRISIICRDLPKPENVKESSIGMKPIPES